MTASYLQGLIPDMTNADYHDHVHIGSSGFKLLRRSPLHFWTASPLNPDRERKDPTIYMLMGTAWHTGIWEPHLFDSTYAPKPDLHASSTVYKLFSEAMTGIEAFKAKYVGVPEGLTKTSKEGKALYAEIAAGGRVGVDEATLAQVLELEKGLRGKTLLDADSLADVRAMSRAAEIHPTTRVIKAQPGVLCEASIFVVLELPHPITGKQMLVPCRIRPDLHVPPGVSEMFPDGLIVDGKSTDDASPPAFGRTAWNSELYWQAAFYSEIFQHHYQWPRPPKFLWLAQERDKPYACRYPAAGHGFVEYGRQQIRPLLQLFGACLHDNHWPGYPITVEDQELPAYATRVIDQAIGDGGDDVVDISFVGEAA